MTTIAGSYAAHRATRRDAVVELAKVEAMRAVCGPAFWIALAVTAWTAWEARGLDWQGATYFEFTLAFAVLAAGIFVAGVRAGGRDRRADDHGALAEEAALDGSARTVARLLGLVPLIAIGAVLVLATQVAIRIEGGHWIGDSPGRTDTAVHGWAEILQPILFFVLAASVGVAAGRTFRRRVPVIVMCLALWFLFTASFWMWQWSPARYVTPVQSQPIELAIEGDATDVSKFPDAWLLVEPEEAGGEWRRAIVHQPMVAGHDLYLAGLAILAVGIALRGRAGRRLLAAGLAVTVMGLAVQVLVAPENAVTSTVPL